MADGTIKWFNRTKGYGFIQPKEGGNDIFLHISSLERSGIKKINDGQKVTYEISEKNGKKSAINLTLID